MAKQFLNKDVENCVEQSLLGFTAAYSRYYKKNKNYNAIYYKGHRKNKVAIVIGGGSGHEPLFPGYCGSGLADAVCCGNICASPNPELIYETAKMVDQGKGVLFIYGCYAGDNLNFDMGEEICRQHGIRTAHVRVWDDFVSAPKERITDRRGIAGDLFTFKIAGAAADSGLSLEEVLRITESARDNLGTIGVATYPATLPGNESPTFTMAEDEMEYGMGLHGEPGIERTKFATADVIVDRMYTEIQQEMMLKNEEVAVLVNGLGSTSLLELNTIYYNLYKHLQKDGLHVHDADIGSYCTCMAMGGFSITILRLNEELKKYYDMPCYSPYYAKGAAKQLEPDETDDDSEILEEREIDTPIQIERSKEGILTELNAEDVRNMLLYVAQKVIKNKPYLTEIDSAIGDGDHGIGMAGGMQKVSQKLSQMKGEKNVYRLFEVAGNAMLMSMGGASGVIFGSLYLAGAQDMDPQTILTGSALADMEKKSLVAIQKRGGAKVGDKTMVDALSPAVDAMDAAREKSLVNLLCDAEEAAKQGVEQSKIYIAKFGRAKSLLERAIGHQDAGATSVYLIFQGMREFVEDKCEG